MKTFKIIFSALLISSLFILSSCKKDRDDLNDTTVASDNEQNETFSNDVMNIADNAAKTGSAGYRTSEEQEVFDVLSTCATVTHDTISTPRVLIIDFGSSNCLCADGRNRRGKIIVTYTGRYFEIGAIKTMNFDNFYRNDNKLEGTRTITNNGLDAQGRMNWTINAQNMKITKSNGKVHTWNSVRTRTMLAGNDTKTWTDDVYQITGSASGTNANGINYTANITKPLHRAMNCRWIDSGTIEITPEGRAVRTVDFGNGNCDDQATVNVRNKTRNITLN
ncbi:MAG TPA: hypothetical protein PK323_01100 [Bacteroidia bacterium]|nr:hypothetical protein [Bacteroidia bacterium]